MTVTGKSDDDPYPMRIEHEELRGEQWDFDDADEIRKRLPRIAALQRWE